MTRFKSLFLCISSALISGTESPNNLAISATLFSNNANLRVFRKVC